MNTRKIGQEQEAAAAAYLESKGYKIIERNFHCPMGEIDCIGFHEGYLVFIEVKFRKTLQAGYPEEAVTAAKQKKICKTALWYLASKEIPDNVACRFDVVSVMPNEIKILENVFSFYG